MGVEEIQLTGVASVYKLMDRYCLTLDAGRWMLLFKRKGILFYNTRCFITYCNIDLLLSWKSRNQDLLTYGLIYKRILYAR